MNMVQLKAEMRIIADLLAASSLLAWDMRTMMPAGSVTSRGEQLATLAQLARERLLSDELSRILDGAEREAAKLSATHDDRLVIGVVRAAIEHHRRLPNELVRARNVLKVEAQAAWTEARARSDFAIFAPFLAKTVDLARQQAEALGYADHPHDALLAQFEPGVTWRSLAPIFATLRARLKPLRDQVLACPPAPSLPPGPYPIDVQRELGRTIARRFGYDFDRGRLDPTVHPFELAMTRNDVRITARYSEAIIDVGLKATMHEAGHGLYEQNIDPALMRSALALDLTALSSSAGASLGVHESQSRLWENHVGRSRGFWARTYPELQSAFPVLANVALETFYRSFNAVRSGAIRTESDELSYDFHIMLRTDLERSLLDGSLAVRHLPAAWNDAMLKELGVVVPSDREGVLQDIHWSMGQFGSFCSYTVGNVLAAQVWQAVVTPAIAGSIATGEFAPLRLALTEKIYRHGRRMNPPALIEAATGRPLDPEPYVEYLTRKYSELYDLS